MVSERSGVDCTSSQLCDCRADLSSMVGSTKDITKGINALRGGKGQQVSPGRDRRTRWGGGGGWQTD